MAFLSRLRSLGKRLTPVQSTMILQYRVAAEATPGNITTSYATVPLNTQIGGVDGATFDDETGEIELPAGEYLAEFWVSGVSGFSDVLNMQTRVSDVDDSGGSFVQMFDTSGAGFSMSSASGGAAGFSLDEATAITLQARAAANVPFGVATPSGWESQVVAQLKITKIT